jgi:predicted RNA-binding protein YlxR (DUF448 family)
MPKHIPERSCVACRTVRPKRHLVRLVRTPEGTVEVDTSWRKPGRGAYLCPAQECWQLAARRKSLDHELKVTLTPETWQVLNAYAEGLPRQKHDS